MDTDIYANAPLVEMVGVRGFVRHDGSVFGWNLLTGDHNEYHHAHSTDDADFATRWRLWGPRDTRIDFEARPVDPTWEDRVWEWLEDHRGEPLPIDQAETP